MLLPVDIVIQLVEIYRKEIITSENQLDIDKDVQEVIICNHETLEMIYVSNRKIKWQLWDSHMTEYHLATGNNISNPFYDVGSAY